MNKFLRIYLLRALIAFVCGCVMWCAYAFLFRDRIESEYAWMCNFVSLFILSGGVAYAVQIFLSYRRYNKIDTRLRNTAGKLRARYLLYRSSTSRQDYFQFAESGEMWGLLDDLLGRNSKTAQKMRHEIFCEMARTHRYRL